jgi:hypothetical protein
MPGLKSSSPLPIFRKTGVALLFALCGAGSSRLLDSRNGSSSDTLVVAVGIPFALLALFFFWRGVRGILAVPIVVGTWIVACNAAAMLAGMDMGIPYLPMCVWSNRRPRPVSLRFHRPPEVPATTFFRHLPYRSNFRTPIWELAVTQRRDSPRRGLAAAVLSCGCIRNLASGRWNPPLRFES